MPAAKQAIREFDKTNKNVSATARYVFKPNVFDLLQKEPFRLGEYLVGQDIFDRLMEKDDLVRINIKGEFYDVGNPLSYMKTETAFALSEPEIKDEYWKFIRKLVLEKELGKDYSKVEFLKKQFRSTYKEFLKQKFYSDSKLKVELREKYRKFLKKVVWASYNGEYQKLRVFLENMIK